MVGIRPSSSHSTRHRGRRAVVLAVLVSACLAAFWGVVLTPATASTDNKVDAAILDGEASSFWVEFAGKAGLAAASQVDGWAALGAAVNRALQRTADASQVGARRVLTAAGASFQPFYIVNAIYVRSGEASLAAELARDPQVTRIRLPRTYELDPVTAGDDFGIDAVEWGVSAINADDVWSTYGVSGEGIVVANIDTGVQFDHPALVGKYRGNLGGGSFDHNYNWYDPSNVCGNPSVAPCDNNAHGTHTMGTMVGDDGASNQIGVARGARWIAAKGCETNSCSDAALLAAGQWILAPTDLAGTNPRPDLRPNIVNNSWGGGGGDPWYSEVVDAWTAAGIFPAFSTGNDGPGCGTAGSPGDYVTSYASGAFDINGIISGFSSRGPGPAGLTKPNLAAPGVDIRSSVPGGGYAAFNGTSMASPHTAGTVALIWSAVPSLVGDIDATTALLDGTAVDVDSTGCGGTVADNNTFGEGKLDAFAAVTAALGDEEGPPVATDDSYSVAEDDVLTVSAPGVLGNDSDPDNDALTAAVASGPSHGGVVLNANGSFTYTPAANFNGGDSFTYDASDGDETSSATVHITVTAVNDAPRVEVVRGGTCTSNVSGTMNLRVSDIDSPASTLTLSRHSSNAVLLPPGNVSFGGSGQDRTMTATVVAGRTGTAVVTVTVSDGSRSSTTTVTVKAGGSGNNTISGTGGADLIFGQGGNDTVSGLGGNDLLCGGGGKDTIVGGPGDDTVSGAAGNDKLTGNAGADWFRGGPGIDSASDFNAGQGDTKLGIP